jgi:hypothetical protein
LTNLVDGTALLHESFSKKVKKGLNPYY